MTAEEVLNTMSEPENETLQFCMIDPETRTISLPDCYKIFGVESDENTTRVRFRCPVIVGDDVDLMDASLRIIYQNANKEEGPPYIVNDAVLNDDYVEFSWLLGRHVTEYKGAVTFIFCAVKTDADGHIINEWNTTLASSKVLEGLEPDTASIEDAKDDIIAQLLSVVYRDIQVTVTKESISSALGYTPANEEDVARVKSDFTELETEVADVKGAFNEQKARVDNFLNGELETVIPTKNKKMIVFGDSITETATMNDDGSNYVEGKRSNWLTYAKEILKTTNFKNYAKSGARYKDSTDISGRQWLSNQIAIAMSDTNNDDADIIVLSLGTNDGEANDTYENAMAVGTLDSLDRTKLHQAIRYAMWTLKKKYPNAKCFVATPIQRAAKEQPVSLRNAIISMANRYNFKVIDAEYESGICRDNEVLSGEGVDLVDGLHPNTNGKVKLAQYYSSAILSEFLYDAYNYAFDVVDDIILPIDYQRVEYIESSGTQYIDTTVLASDYSDGIGYEFDGVVSSGNTSAEWLWGALSDGKRSGNVAIATNNDVFALYVGANGSAVARSVQLTLDERITITSFASSLYPFDATLALNGAVDSSVDNEALTSSDMPSVNIHLLKCNGSSRTPSKVKIYSFKMRDGNGSEIRNFIPCYRVSDNTIGLYDIVNDTFYENAGTGTFTKGADV